MSEGMDRQQRHRSGPTPSAVVSSVIEPLYASFADPAAIGAFLARLFGALRSESGAVMGQDSALCVGGVLAQHGLPDDWGERYARSVAANNPIAPYSAPFHRPGSVFRTSDCLPMAEFRRWSYYDEFFHPNGILFSVNHVIEGSTSRVLLISAARTSRRGDYSDRDLALLRSIDPHLQRVAGLHRLTGAIGLTALRRWTGLRGARSPACLMTGKGAIVEASDAMEAVLAKGYPVRRCARDRLVITEPSLATAFELAAADAASRMASDRHGTSDVVSWKTAANRHGHQFRIGVCHLPASPFDFYAVTTLLVLEGDMIDAAPDMLERVVRTHGLTTAETRICRQLLAGHTGVEAAGRLGVSVATVRTHLRSVFRKTGTRRQSDLLRLLLGSATNAR